MALQTYEHDLIITVGQKYGYTVKMKFRCLISNHLTKTLSIQWNVYFVDEEDNEVNTHIIRSFSMEQIADNATFVNPLTGEFLEQPIDFEQVDAMGEYDFYWQLVNNVDTQLPQLILAAGERFKVKVLNQI